MSPDPLRLAFVMDPLAGIDIDADTTFALMLEAQRRGHRVFAIDPDDLGVAQGRPSALMRPVELRREKGSHFDLGSAQRAFLDEATDVIFQRVDPPVDEAYIVATQILGMCERSLVLNRPSGILAHNEKLFALHFRELMPDTIVSRHREDLIDFMAEMGGEMIVKPLDGKGGEGVFHLTKDDRNLFSILEQSTRFETRRVMAQRYLPEIRRGDKRILLLEGEILGAVTRVPSEREVRANLHVGGRAVRAEISEVDRRIALRLGPALRREGLFFVGIDVIGDQLTEVNVTSPTGLQEIDALDGAQLEERVLGRVEERARERRR